jgi:cytochrome P450
MTTDRVTTDTDLERDPRSPVVDFNHFAHESRTGGDNAYRELRSKCPVAWTDAAGGFWVASRQAEIAAAFRDWKTFSSARTDPEISTITVGGMRFKPFFPEEMDPPDWTPLRKILSELLAPSAVERLRPRVRHWVAHFIDQVIEKGACEVSYDIVCPVPAAVTLEWLGFPEDEWMRIANTWHDAAAYQTGTPENEAALENFVWVHQRIAEEVSDRRVTPRDDVISIVSNRVIDGERISTEIAEAIVFLIIGGGVDTTTSVATAAIVHLATNPEDRRRLTEDPDLWDTAMEEFLRVYPAARSHARTVTKDIEFGGANLRAGDQILLSELSACQDELAFPDADEFQIDRFPNRHLAFGMGIHRCPGSHLARIEVKEIVSQMLERMPDYSIDPDQVVEYPNWAVIGGWAKVPATFTAGPRVLS